MNIITAKELAILLKLTESTIYTLASEGELPGFRIGNSWRFDMDEIMLHIKGAKERGRRGLGKQSALYTEKRDGI